MSAGVVRVKPDRATEFFYHDCAPDGRGRRDGAPAPAVAHGDVGHTPRDRVAGATDHVHPVHRGPRRPGARCSGTSGADRRGRRDAAQPLAVPECAGRAGRGLGASRSTLITVRATSPCSSVRTVVRTLPTRGMAVRPARAPRAPRASRPGRTSPSRCIWNGSIRNGRRPAARAPTTSIPGMSPTYHASSARRRSRRARCRRSAGRASRRRRRAGVDDARHLDADARPDLRDSGLAEPLRDGAVGVRHDAEAHAGRGERAQAVDRTRDDARPEPRTANSLVEVLVHVVAQVVGDATRGDVRLEVRAPVLGPHRPGRVRRDSRHRRSARGRARRPAARTGAAQRTEQCGRDRGGTAHHRRRAARLSGSRASGKSYPGHRDRRLVPWIDMEFRRINALPPYAFAQIDALKMQLRRAGEDVIDLAFGNPDMPSPPVAVEKLAEAVRNPRNHRYSTSKGIPKLRARGRRSVRAQVRRHARLRDRDLLHDRCEGRLLAPDADARRSGRHRARAEPVVPDPHLGTDPRRRRRALRAHGPGARTSSRTCTPRTSRRGRDRA